MFPSSPAGSRVPVTRAMAALLLLSVLALAEQASCGMGDLVGRLERHLHLLTVMGFDEALALAAVFLVTALGLVGLLDRRRRTSWRAFVEQRSQEDQTVRDMALRDPLTELWNRRGLERCHARPIAAGEGRAVILCDLDGFKHVNDRHGHAAGDALLRRFAQRLDEIRIDGVAIDCVRLGGDEFTLHLVGHDLMAVASRLAIRLSEINETVGAEAAPVTVSIGVAIGDGESRLDELLAGADAAMYDAKRSGDAFRVFTGLGEGSAHPKTRVFERFVRDVSHEGDRRFFVAAVGLDQYQTVRRAHGAGVCGKLMRELQHAFEHAGASAERLGPDTLGLLIAANDEDAAVAALTALKRQVVARTKLTPVGDRLALTCGLAGPASADTLRQHAETAQDGLDEAWRTGQSIVCRDSRKQDGDLADRALIENLTAAITADRLELHYQPKLCTKTGKIDSLEALARWSDPSLGSIPPSRFVPLAEQLGAIRRLTDWVVERAIADQAVLVARGIDLPIYVNISAKLICEEEFAADLMRRLVQCQGKIGIEITETAVLTDPEHALRHLHQFAAAGVSIAIDDYGVGLSSLAYLKQLPAHELKIDMLFITDLADSHRDPMIVRSTIDLAHGLGLRVTAEGVSDPMSLGLLKIMGCDLLQGYEISPPLPLDELQAFLGEGRAGEAPLHAFQQAA